MTRYEVCPLQLLGRLQVVLGLLLRPLRLRGLQAGQGNAGAQDARLGKTGNVISQGCHNDGFVVSV